MKLYKKQRGIYKMELVYLYVRKYDELFSEQEFNFSQNYHVTLKNNELFLEETKNIF